MTKIAKNQETPAQGTSVANKIALAVCSLLLVLWIGFLTAMAVS